MLVRFRTPPFVALIALATVAALASPSDARGGRGGRGAGGSRPGGGGDRPSAGPRGATLGGSNLSSQNFGGPNTTKNIGGQLGNSPRNLAGNQRLSGALKQSGQPGIQQTQVNLSGAQSLQGKFQQHAGEWQNRTPGQRSGEAQQNFQNRASEFQDRPEPFSAAWYADHPNAWQYNHPHADAAVVATAAGVAAWTGAYYVPEETTGSTTIVYQEVPADETAAQQQPVPSADPVAPIADEWMALGTYSLNANPNAPPAIMLQLAVNHAGELKGVYYDSLTNTTQNISGSLDRASQIAQWSLDSNPQSVFSAPLEELLKSTGTVEVQLATGPQQWQLMRVEDK